MKTRPPDGGPRVGGGEPSWPGTRAITDRMPAPLQLRADGVATGERPSQSAGRGPIAPTWTRRFAAR